MHWATGRQFLIWAILIAIVVAIGAAVTFVVLYKVPSCTDNVQNQDETGVDCGGSCATVCSSDTQLPEVQFVRTLNQAFGRTDVIAYVLNRNAAAETSSARYTLELYDANNALVTTSVGTMQLKASVHPTPLFIPGAYLGTKVVTHAFLTFADPVTWTAASPLSADQQFSSEYTILGADSAPKITATIHNPQPLPFHNLKVVVAVFDASDSVIAASQTVITEVPAQGDAQAIFTWNNAFAASPTKVDILPLYP